MILCFTDVVVTSDGHISSICQLYIGIVALLFTSYAFQVDMVNEESYLHIIILPTDEGSYAWVAREPLRVVSIFTTNVTGVGVKVRDCEVLASVDNRSIRSEYPMIFILLYDVIFKVTGF